MRGHSCRLYFAIPPTSPCDHTLDNSKPYITDARTPDRTRAPPDAPGNESTTLVVCVSALLPPPIAILLLARTIHVQADLHLFLTGNPHIATRRSDNLRLPAG